MSTRGHWYAATLIFECRVGGVRSLRPLCEERVVLFRGSNESQVLRLAKMYGRSAEHSYPNRRREVVEWRFARIETLERLELPPVQGGWEVAYRFVRRKAKDLRR
jgi:hypothetical protein